MSFVSPESGASVPQKNEILRLRRDWVVAIDYAQHVDAQVSRSRYERVSDTCEQGCRLAKKHRAVVILVSQAHRQPNGKGDASSS